MCKDVGNVVGIYGYRHKAVCCLTVMRRRQILDRPREWNGDEQENFIDLRYLLYKRSRVSVCSLKVSSCR